jgi:hypothetical protein
MTPHPRNPAPFSIGLAHQPPFTSPLPSGERVTPASVLLEDPVDSLASLSEPLDDLRDLLKPLPVQNLCIPRDFPLVQCRRVAIKRRTRLGDNQERVGLEDDGFDGEAEVAQEGEVGGNEADVGDEGVDDGGPCLG